MSVRGHLGIAGLWTVPDWPMGPAQGREEQQRQLRGRGVPVGFVVTQAQRRKSQGGGS